MVHLACGEVAALLREAGDAARWLTGSERTRLEGVQKPARREQFLAARWQARWLLAQVFGGAPEDWPLEAPHDAPPAVAARPELFLSISHSGTRTACALASSPVGLDLEQPRRQRDVAGLVALCCTPAEQALCGGSEAMFHELWTVKEAWLKRRGEWIAPQRLVQLECTPQADGEVTTWREAGSWLAVTAREVRWWTGEPASSRAWRVKDLVIPAEAGTQGSRI